MSRSKYWDQISPDLSKQGQGSIQQMAHRKLEDDVAALQAGVEAIQVPSTPSSIGAASLTEPYVTISVSSGLSAERVLTGTTNQITVTDGGANSTVTLSTPQNLHTAAVFQVERLGISGAATVARSIALFDADASAAVSIVAHATTTAHTLVLPAAQGAANSILVNDGSGNLSTTTAPRFTSVGINGASGSAQELKLYNAVGTDAITIRAVVALLTAHTLILPSAQGAANSVLGNDGSGNLGWYTGALTSSFVTTNSEGQLTSERVLTGTANQITVTDNGAGSTVVLSTPQNLHTAATFQVGTLGIGGAAGGGFALDVVTGPSILRSTGAATPITAYGDGGLTSYGVEVYDTGTASTVAAMGLDGSVSCSSFVMGFPGVNTGTLQAPALSAARVYSMPDITGTVMLLQGTQTVSGAKTFTATCVFTGNSVLEVSSAADVRFRDGSDSSKLMFFDVSRFAASTNRVKGWTNNDGVVCDDGNVVCADGEVVTSGGEIVLAY